MGRGWGRGRGHGRGWSRGYGWGHGYYPMGVPGVMPVYGAAPHFAPPSREQEVQALRAQAEHLEGTLKEIRKRITDLEAGREEKD